jgi:hypothetical protein
MVVRRWKKASTHRLGVSASSAKQIEEETGMDALVNVLVHLQRAVLYRIDVTFQRATAPGAVNLVMTANW